LLNFVSCEHVAGSTSFTVFPSVLWHCWFGDNKGIRPVNSWVLVCCWWRFDWSFANLVALVVTPPPVTSLGKGKGKAAYTWYSASS